MGRGSKKVEKHWFEHTIVNTNSISVTPSLVRQNFLHSPLVDHDPQVEKPCSSTYTINNFWLTMDIAALVNHIVDQVWPAAEVS